MFWWTTNVLLSAPVTQTWQDTPQPFYKLGSTLGTIVCSYDISHSRTQQVYITSLAATSMSQMVTHPSTNRAQSCLTSVIRLQMVAPCQCELHGQLWHLEALALIQNLHHASPHWWLWHSCGCNCSCHCGLLPQSLGMCHTISHYYDDTLAGIAQLCICILYCQGPGVRTHLQHKGPESSHLAPHQCKLFPSLHV